MTKLHLLARRLLIGYVCLLIIAATVVVGFWKFQHVRLLSVQTDSMAPTYRPHDALLVSPASSLHPGQIISYVSPKDPSVVVSHRLLSMDHLLVTKGDNLPKPDVAFSSSLVVGQVSADLPKLGYVLDFLHQPLGIAVAVYLPALFVAVTEIRRLSVHFGRGYYRLLSFR